MVLGNQLWLDHLKPVSLIDLYGGAWRIERVPNFMLNMTKKMEAIPEHWQGF